MATEIELKFLDVDVEEMKEKILKIGAKLVFDTEMESIVFLGDEFSTRDSSKKYLRLRKINDTTLLTFKSPRTDSNMTSRDEHETEVKDFDATLEILKRLGFNDGVVSKKHRMHYELGNIHFELDTVEGIPTYLEIETTTEEDMKDICKKMNIDISKGKKGTIVEILPEKFKELL